ncbi:hypothetical protein BVX93_01880 [bacterium B13(2017)]|nr:hypothetical protein BVX93_01880 [bacterium B13(2017)]
MIGILSISQRISFFEKNIYIFIFIIVSTIFIGMIFPMLSALATKKISLMGNSVGSIYLFNTLGNVSGALLTGFIFIPFLGTENSYSFLIFINIFLFVFISFKLIKDSNRTSLVISGVILSFPLLYLMNNKGYFSDHYYRNKFGNDIEILYSYENSMDRKVVLKKGKSRYLLAGPYLSGSTDKYRRSVQILQGHIPMMLSVKNPSVLEIGYGIGEIAHHIYSYNPSRFDIVEIDPMMIPIANNYFAKINDCVSKKERVRTFIMDGRHYLDITDKTFDVIMNDTFYIISEGASRLYTYDHFITAKKRLSKKGICIVWVPSNLVRNAALSIIKTFKVVFQNFTAWQMSLNEKKTDLFLIGYKGGFTLNLEVIRERYNKFAKEEFKNIGINSFDEFMKGFINREIFKDELFSDIRIHTKDRPFIDYTFMQWGKDTEEKQEFTICKTLLE